MKKIIAGVLSAAVTAAIASEKIILTQFDLTDRASEVGDVRVGRTFSGEMTMMVDGEGYWTGLMTCLGMHANSHLTVELGEGAIKLETDCAVDDRTLDGLAQFQILLDGKVVADSGLVTRHDKAKHFSVDLRGAKKLTFKALDGGDGNKGDHCNWVNIKIDYEDGKYPPGDVRTVSPRQLGILTPKSGPAPRINGPKVFGVRPGNPVLYRLPVTGLRPMELSARNLPKGLTFDSTTQVLSGSVEKRGEYAIIFSAKNSKGEAERTLTLKVGDNICLTPALGWNSWNAFGNTITAEKVVASAEAMISSGLADHGWRYINIDDCWQNSCVKADDKCETEDFKGPARHADGTIATNRRFPDMKKMTERIHALGLKAGIYSSPGLLTCAGHAGSFGYEAKDAKTFAEWGFDFIKYDWCSYWEKQFGEGVWRMMPPYWLMGRALAEQKRDIVFSLCEYGLETPGLWGNIVYGHSWRTTGDVFDIWESVAGAIESQKRLFPYSRPGAFNDPDMLCVGPVRFNDFKGSRLAPNEQYTHISLWALMASPLMIGCDMTKLDDFTLSLLTNDEVLDINQDSLGLGAGCVAEGDGWEIWARPLEDGSIAAGLYNKSLREQTIVMNMSELGMECKWRVRDVWRQADEGVFLGKYEHSVPGHATHLVKFTPLACATLRDGMVDIRDNAWKLIFKKDGAPREMLRR